MATIQAPISECPACGGEVWNNVGTKKNPKGPDYKCKSCQEAYWLPKGNGQPTYQPKPAPLTYAPAKAVPSPDSEPPSLRDAQLIALYWDSFDAVLAGLAQRKLTDLFGKDIGALVSTLYIQRARG